MKRIIFLFVLATFFLGQNVYAAQKDGVCLNYYGNQCTSFRYCVSNTVNGCNSYETCNLEYDKFACVLDKTANSEKIYRPKSFVNDVVSDYKKPFYTSPVVEQTRKQNFRDYNTHFTDQSRSRYTPINQNNTSTVYYPPKAEPYTLEELVPPHNIWVDQEKPRTQDFTKYKYPDNAGRHGGMWFKRLYNPRYYRY